MKSDLHLKIGLFLLIFLNSVIIGIANDKIDKQTKSITVANNDVQIIDINPTVINTIYFNFDINVISPTNLDVKIIGRRLIINKFTSKYEPIIVMSQNGKVSVTLILKASNTFPLNLTVELEKDDLLKTLGDYKEDKKISSYTDSLIASFEEFLNLKLEHNKAVGEARIESVIKKDIILSEVNRSIAKDFIVAKYDLFNTSSFDIEITEADIYNNKNIKAIIVPEQFLSETSKIKIEPNKSIYIYMIFSNN